MADPSGQQNPTTMSDEQLVESYRRGQIEVFEVLINRYRSELLNFLLRFTGDRTAAEDVFQETFLQVHLSAETFDTDRNFKPWLFTIASNKARDYMRKRARRPAAPLDAPVGGAGGEGGQTFVDLLEGDLPLPDQKLQENELQALVQRTIDQMPDHLREILVLSYFQRFSYNEIADMLQIPLGTVKSRLHTAVATFAKLWKRVNLHSGTS
ncbi:MAG: RNA polymerase sigma factor [Phycisphaeraceae bacterium]